MIGFRLPIDVYEKLKVDIDRSNLSDSRFFREMIVQNSNEIILKEEDNKTLKQILFINSKASNNLNQIAKKLNVAYRSEIVNERTFLETLKLLQQLEKSFFNFELDDL